MLRLSIREYTPEGVRGRKINTVKDTISVTDLENGAASLSFAISAATEERIIHDEFVVGVEYAVGGEFIALPRNDLFLVSANNGDDAEPTKTITFTGESYPYTMLLKHWVIGGANVKDGKLQFKRDGADTNAGDIARAEFDESRSAGWAPQISYNFTHLKDSNGENWTVEDRQQMSISVPVTQEQLISALVEQGMCEVETRGTEIRLLRPGTTRDRTNVVLGGPEFSRIPVKVNAKDRYTRLHVVMDGGKDPVFSVPVPGADTRFGTVDALITLSGVTDRATAEKIATQRAIEGAAVQREESYEWTPTAQGFVPLRDFQVGDTVMARVRGGEAPRRVIGIVLQEQDDVVTARAIVGDHIASSTLRSLRKLSSVAVGGIVGGSGESFLYTPLPATSPTKPVGLRITSNTGEWSSDGITALSNVGLEWDAVTQDIDGGEITIPEYEVWSRLPSTTASFDTATNTNSVEVNTYRPGEERLVSVRARSQAGAWSEWSNELSVTPVAPSSIVPKAPEVVTVTSNVGAWTPAGPVATVTLAIPAVTESTDNEPIDIAEYELWDSSGPLVRVPSTSATVKLSSGVNAHYRARARSTPGVWGDLSTASTAVTGATPDTAIRAPSTPILATGYGDVVARWDGTYTGGGTSGAHTVWAEAQIAAKTDPIVPATPWERQGPALMGNGTTLIQLGEVGDTINVRLVAYDQMGRETGVSAVASIVVETIDGASLTLGSIKVDHLAPNVGDTLNLSANAAIVLMVEQQTEISSTINEVQSAVDSVADAAEEAAQVAAAAQAAAEIADGKALVAQVTATQAVDGLAAQQAVFVVTATGAEVRSKDASNIVQILPTGVAIVQGGVAVSTWDGARFISNEIITNRAQLGNHVLEKSGTRTVFRAL